MRWRSPWFLLIFLSQISWSQRSGHVHIACNGVAHFIITDSLGRRAGFDPRIGVKYEEIPNSGYGLACCGSIDTSEAVEEAWEFMFLESVDALFTEKYAIEFIGRGRGIYSGDVYAQQTLSRWTTLRFRGVIDSLESVFYKFTFTNDSSQLPTLRKVVDTTTFRQDLNNCYHLNLVRSPLYQNLATEIRKVDSLLALGDTLATIRELLQFENLLEQASGDTTKIMHDGYKILKEDASILVTALNAWRGTITQSATWSNTVYVVADVEIIGTTLTIAPGTTVKFFENTGLTVSGILAADGSSGRITLTGISSSVFWNGISVLSSCHATANLAYASIQNAGIAIAVGILAPVSSEHFSVLNS